MASSRTVRLRFAFGACGAGCADRRTDRQVGYCTPSSTSQREKSNSKSYSHSKARALFVLFSGSEGCQRRVLHALHVLCLLQETWWGLTGAGSSQIPSRLSPLSPSPLSPILSSASRQGSCTLMDFSSWEVTQHLLERKRND